MLLVPRQHFADYDHLLAAVQGWQTDFKLLSLPTEQQTLYQFVTPEIAIGELAMSARVLQQGQAPEGYRTFALLAQDSTEILWQGQSVDRNTLIIKPRQQQFDCVSYEGFHVYTVSINEQRLGQLLAITDNRGLDEILAPCGTVVTSDPATMDRLRQIIRLCCGSGQIPEVSLPIFIEAVSSLLLQLLLPANQPKTLPGTLCSRQKLVRNFLDYQLDSQVNLSMPDTASSLGVSQRTLQYAVMESFGITPKQLANRLRLNQARQLLKIAHKGGRTVTEVAQQWGFNHSGQFSRDYKALFGESPRTTLHN